MWSCIELDKESKNKIIKLFKSVDPTWIRYADHITINPFDKVDDSLIGKEYKLLVTHIGLSEKAVAVKVSGYDGQTNNSFPHVTVAIDAANGAKQKDSNLIKNWSPLKNKLFLKGTVINKN